MQSTPIINSVTRLEGGSYMVGFEGRTGLWSAVYLADGQLSMTIWEPEAHIPRIDPAELERRAVPT